MFTIEHNKMILRIKCTYQQQQTPHKSNAIICVIIVGFFSTLVEISALHEWQNIRVEEGPIGSKNILKIQN